MHALILVHRWLGIVLCLFFAMWFATGIVMHFVPFPAMNEAERIAGLAAIDAANITHGPGAALAASGIVDATRVRLQARSDGPVYLIEGKSGLRAVHAADLSPATVSSEDLALAIAAGQARRRGIDAMSASIAELASHDQWTVSGNLDRHRPLYRVAINDAAGSEFYVSSATGEIVRDTTRHERQWNYAGSVAHWIYPTLLRQHARTWNAAVWTLSLVALIAAVAGAMLGILRLQWARGHLTSPFRGWLAWHHWLGLFCMTFVISWIFSGWLSMDHGLPFSSGKPAANEAVNFVDAGEWAKISGREALQIPANAREVEWFAFGGQIYRRDRFDLTSQRLSFAADTPSAAASVRAFLQADEVTAAIGKFAANCRPAVAVQSGDDYPLDSAMPGAPVYRSVCGEVWFHVDSASGAMLEKLDASRRAYRWAYSALHTLDFPALTARPALRTVLIVTLCGLGLIFSLTAVVIGWRRLRTTATGQRPERV